MVAYAASQTLGRFAANATKIPEISGAAAHALSAVVVASTPMVGRDSQRKRPRNCTPITQSITLCWDRRLRRMLPTDWVVFAVTRPYVGIRIGDGVNPRNVFPGGAGEDVGRIGRPQSLSGGRFRGKAPNWALYCENIPKMAPRKKIFARPLRLLFRRLRPGIVWGGSGRGGGGETVSGGRFRSNSLVCDLTRKRPRACDPTRNR